MDIAMGKPFNPCTCYALFYLDGLFFCEHLTMLNFIVFNRDVICSVELTSLFVLSMYLSAMQVAFIPEGRKLTVTKYFAAMFVLLRESLMSRYHPHSRECDVVLGSNLPSSYYSRSNRE
jgi:hypothetical protein